MPLSAVKDDKMTLGTEYNKKKRQIIKIRVGLEASSEKVMKLEENMSKD